MTIQSISNTENRIPGRDRSWIEAIFHEWGDWVWEIRDYQGYPRADAVAAAIMGAGGGKGGHRILCCDFPEGSRGKRIQMTHALWIMLPEQEQVAMWVEYVPGADDNGRVMSRVERCERIEVSEAAFEKRLQRARHRIWKWSKMGRR